MSNKNVKRGPGRPPKVVKKKFIDDEAEEVKETHYTNEELEIDISDEEDDFEMEEVTEKPKVGQKRAAEKPLEQSSAKAAKVQPKPSAPAVKSAVPKPKPKPKPVLTIKGKEKEDSPAHNRTKARGLVSWDYSEDRSVTNVDLDNYESVLSRIYINRRGSSGWNFEVGYYVESDEEWLAAGGQLPRSVKPIRFCFQRPHRMHFVPSRFGDGQWGSVKLADEALKKKPYSVSLDLDLDNEKYDFDRKLLKFYTDFRKVVGELILKKVPVADVIHFFELPPADDCLYWYANPFLDDLFFKGMFTVSDEGRGHLKVKFPLSFTGEKLFTLGDLSVPEEPRTLPSPDYIQADEGLAGTFEFGDIWVAKLKKTKPNDAGEYEEYFAAGQTANATIVWRFTTAQTEKICGPATGGGQDKLKLEANKSVDIKACGFLANGNFTLDN